MRGTHLHFIRGLHRDVSPLQSKTGGKPVLPNDFQQDNSTPWTYVMAWSPLLGCPHDTPALLWVSAGPLCHGSMSDTVNSNHRGTDPRGQVPVSALGRTEGGEGVRGHPPLSTASDSREQKETLRRAPESQGGSGKHWALSDDMAGATH